MSNPADPRPLYQQLAALLRDQVHSGELAPGAQLPTEADLAALYRASRNTVRGALNVLRAEGLVTSHQGLGNFVRLEPPMKYFASLTGSRSKRLEAARQRDTFAQQIEAQGKTSKQVSTTEVAPASPEIASRLQLGEGQPVGVRRRVMYADDEPLQLGDSYYPLDIVGRSKIMNPADVPEGTDQVLEDLGHTPARYEDEITWRMPTSDEATKLHLGPGTPVGRLVRTSFDQSNRPVEVYVVILPGDKHALLYDVDAS
ncbi:MAG: GntR family transcriptional regulator [Pseudonocardiaceae bacterium]